MAGAHPSIELFLQPAGDRGQTLAHGLATRALAGDRGAADTPDAPAGGDPNSLRDQGWGVIAPRGDEGDRLLALIQPLIDRRAADQDADVPIYRVPPDMTAADAAAWLDRKLVANELAAAIPGYLLALGRPDQVSFELQQVLANAFSVGRLGFDIDADYEAYVHKLIASERSSASAPARAVYFTARDGTPATELACRALMQPCVADAFAQRKAGRFAAQDIVVLDDPDPAGAAGRLLAAATGPSVLFTCSHGAGAPAAGWRSPAEQRAQQGALCLGDGGFLTAAMLAGATFLPGGAWLAFACFSAGTPRHSAYHPWLARLQEHGEHDGDLSSVLASLPRDGEPPFIAALPQAALASPGGPLAVIGHLDLAWSYAFQDVDKLSRGGRHRRFHELVTQLVKRTRVGLAVSGSLMSSRNQVQTELTIASDGDARAGALDAPAARGHRWMVLQDLAGYIVLGDPAARIATVSRGSGDPAA